MAAPLAVDVGLAPPEWATDWRFLKSPVYVPVGAVSTTLALVDAEGRALAWVPAEVWTGGQRPDLSPWATRSVTFESCPARDAVYFGGFLADSAHPCVTIAAASGGEDLGTAQISLDPACS